MSPPRIVPREERRTVDGKSTLLDVFQGRPQLIVHHFVFAPDRDAGSRDCGEQGMDGGLPHTYPAHGHGPEGLGWRGAQGGQGARGARGVTNSARVGT
ncbi:DUF899 family protein [Streptomyces europaeiscabiei]|uniref:DUF899 family protein n=1 Tax=Streptomyces europaeiscabiei TaxID=146819 RepID=UPI0038D4E8E6